MAVIPAAPGVGTGTGGAPMPGGGRGGTRVWLVSYHGVLVAGRYRLRGIIGGGGIGEVWRADDLAFGRPAAVKLLRPEYAGHPEALARFRAAVRIGSVSHPGIARLYDYGEADGSRGP